MIGTVSMFDGRRRFGFIKTEQGKVFLHAAQLMESGFDGTPKHGERLEFDVQQSERGARAVNVKRA